MPELPEVQTIIDSLRPHLLGRTIDQVQLNRADIVTPSDADLAIKLRGRAIRQIDRRAKRIIFLLDNGDRFYIHLGMSGRLWLGNRGIPLPKHTHLIVRLSELSNAELRFVDPRRFGGIWWIGNNSADEQLGPEPLEMRAAELAKRLGRTSRAVKNALLDQRLIAGLGNIYVDESLFAAGIHPLRPANQLTSLEIGRLSRAIKQTLRRALRHRGSTLRDYRDADGNSGAFQSRFRVYDQAGKPCPRCRQPVARIVIGGRSSHFCAQCQKPPPAPKPRATLDKPRSRGKIARP